MNITGGQAPIAAIGVRSVTPAWDVPPLFGLIEQKGGVDHDEMYRVFNMGMAMIVMVDSDAVDAALSVAGEGAIVMGRVTAQAGSASRVILQ